MIALLTNLQWGTFFSSAKDSMKGSVCFGRGWRRRCNSVCVCVLLYERVCVYVCVVYCVVWTSCNGYELHRWSYITHYLRISFRQMKEEWIRPTLYSGRFYSPPYLLPPGLTLSAFLDQVVVGSYIFVVYATSHVSSPVHSSRHVTLHLVIIMIRIFFIANSSEPGVANEILENEPKGCLVL